MPACSKRRGDGAAAQSAARENVRRRSLLWTAVRPRTALNQARLLWKAPGVHWQFPPQKSARIATMNREVHEKPSFLTARAHTDFMSHMRHGTRWQFQPPKFGHALRPSTGGSWKVPTHFDLSRGNCAVERGGGCAYGRRAHETVLHLRHARSRARRRVAGSAAWPGRG